MLPKTLVKGLVQLAFTYEFSKETELSPIIRDFLIASSANDQYFSDAMKKSFLPKIIITLVVVGGFTAVTPAEARAPRPPKTIQPPTPVSGL